MQYNIKDVANLRGKIIADMNEAISNSSVEVFATQNGIGIRLHNAAGIRPTTYHAEFRMNQYGFLNTVVLDTIVWENKKHAVIKRSIPAFNSAKDSEWYRFLLGKLTELALQECSGSREETYRLFTPLGLMMMKKEAIKQETA